VIDAHYHLWQLSRADYGWIGDRTNPAVAPIERDFLVAEFRALAAANGITGSIAVQAAPTVAETRWLLHQAHASDGLILGVVGWIDMAASDATDTLHDLGCDPMLCGIRPMLQDIVDVEWILQPGLAPAILAIEQHNLALDLLVKPPHLKAARALLARHPDLRAIVDHGAKPDIAGGVWQPWADDMRHIARETSAYCKLSGLVTEARPGWQPGDLRRYVNHLFDCFGAGRILWGSDWPVMLLNADYAEWLATAQLFVESLTAAERAMVFHDNAVRFYRLPMKTA
jgi:L-fuconolactonase